MSADLDEGRSWSVPMLVPATLLLVDVLRVWLPSIITIFGQAASTPAELMGGFALLWFVVPFAVVPLWSRLPVPGRRVVMGAAALGLGGSRLALLFVHGGQPQLYVASAGVLCGLVWLATQAMDGLAPVPGVPAGLALAGVQHLVLGTVDLTWRHAWWVYVVVGVEVLWFAAFAGRPVWANAVQGTGWSLVGPAMLLTGMMLLSPAAWTAELSYVTGALPRGVGSDGIGRPVSVWLWLLVLIPAVALWRGATRLSNLIAPPGVTWAVTLVVCVSVFMYVPVHGYGPAIRLLALGFGAWALGRCMSVAGNGATRRRVPSGYAVLGGMAGFAVAAILYYAAYDLGLPNRWVPVAVAVYVAARTIADAGAGEHVDQRQLNWTFALMWPAVGLLTYVAGPMPAPVERPDARSVRLVAYNIRMGFGLDGTFDPDAAAGAVRREHPDVVVLSEVDRAWLLNGGHDTLEVLARRLGMRYSFAPAADPVWGDAVLTNLPITARRSVRLSADGAPTGAQALGVLIRVGGREVAVVSTHIQPPPGRAPLTQVREISTFATGFAGDRPTVVAGDLNIEPGDESMRAFDAAGYADGLAAFRPLPTFPADRPVKQIDHVLVRGALTAADPSVGTTTASDHAPLAVTLRW